MNKPLVIVVYKKKRGKKYYMKILENVVPDDVINGRKRKPLIPDEHEIIEIGWGKCFIERYKKEYNAKEE